eukprot:2239935-Prymnesium_polylepis.2
MPCGPFTVPSRLRTPSAALVQADDGERKGVFSGLSERLRGRPKGGTPRSNCSSTPKGKRAARAGPLGTSTERTAHECMPQLSA